MLSYLECDTREKQFQIVQNNLLNSCTADSKADPVVLPNVMRNILEYYFGFVHRKDQLFEILNKFAESEPDQGHKSFYRYINRESHSDPTNIGIMVNVDPDVYLERFKNIFKATKDEDHFNCMME